MTYHPSHFKGWHVSEDDCERENKYVLSLELLIVIDTSTNWRVDDRLGSTTIVCTINYIT